MFSGMIQSIKADLEANFVKRPNVLGFLYAYFFNPGFKLVIMYRLAHFAESCGVLGRIVSKFVARRSTTLFSCYISPRAKIGNGLCLPHPTGIVIGEGSLIGERNTIYQHVTIGRKDSQESAYPQLGSEVTIYANSIVLGSVVLGDRSTVGAASLVLRDVAPGATVVGAPARPRP